MNNYNTTIESVNSITPLILPALEKAFNLHKLIDIQSQLGNATAQWLDRNCGIDLFISGGTRSLTGVAFRVQYYQDYYSFTVRGERANGHQTELEKRRRDIDEGAISPKYTMQVYLNSKLDPTTVLSAAMIETKKLIEYVEANKENLRFNRCPEGNKFYIIRFDEIEGARIVNGLEIIT